MNNAKPFPSFDVPWLSSRPRSLMNRKKEERINTLLVQTTTTHPWPMFSRPVVENHHQLTHVVLIVVTTIMSTVKMISNKNKRGIAVFCWIFKTFSSPLSSHFRNYATAEKMETSFSIVMVSSFHAHPRFLPRGNISRSTKALLVLAPILDLENDPFQEQAVFRQMCHHLGLFLMNVCLARTRTILPLRQRQHLRI